MSSKADSQTVFSASKRNSTLKQGLERLYREIDISMISPDPLELVLRYADPHDQEVAAFLVSAWSYGRADLIVKNCARALGVMGPSPADFARRVAAGRTELLEGFRGIVHRLHRGGDWAALCLFAGEMTNASGSIAAAFEGFFAESRGDLRSSLAALHRAFHEGGYPERVRTIAPNLEIGDTRHLIADASRGSACKRLNLFLRWVVRLDHIDPGPWQTLRAGGLRPRDLIIPLDTHVSRLGRMLGLTDYSTPGWSMAMDITQSLAAFAPDDPVRYDFALARLGILDICPSNPRARKECSGCPIAKWCREQNRPRK